MSNSIQSMVLHTFVFNKSEEKTMAEKKPGIAIIKNKTERYGWNGKNVRISTSISYSRKAVRVTVRFTTEVAEKITTTQYITPRIDVENERIYFEESNCDSGFKVAIMSKHSRFLQFSCPSGIKCSDNFDGIYDIDFDPNYKMYFVDFGDES